MQSNEMAPKHIDNDLLTCLIKDYYYDKELSSDEPVEVNVDTEKCGLIVENSDDGETIARIKEHEVII